MKRIITLGRSAVFAVATAAALGFGAAQAFAEPAAPREALACSAWACPECGSLGGQWVPKDGRCYCCG